MNQVHGGNYQYYQPSYNSYRAPSSGQWGVQNYNSQSTHQTYGYEVNSSPEPTYVYPSYTTPKSYSTPCMGQCNPPKLYADTYNYLTENLMKPVIEEVYNDLKSITSANTVANHALASKIGLAEKQGQSQQNNPDSQDKK